MYLIIGEVDGFIEEKNGNKYLFFLIERNCIFTDKNKEVLKKYAEFWDWIKNKIETINGGKKCEYAKDFMKIIFDSDDDLRLNKPVKLRMLTIVVRFVFQEDGKFYPQIYLGVVWIIKMFQYEKIDISEGIGINKTSASKECMLFHNWYFKDVGFKFEPHVCNKCHDVLMTVYELKNIMIVNVKGVGYKGILWDIRKNEAINILNNSVLKDKDVL